MQKENMTISVDPTEPTKVVGPYKGPETYPLAPTRFEIVLTSYDPDEEEHERPEGYISFHDDPLMDAILHDDVTRLREVSELLEEKVQDYIRQTEEDNK